MRLEDNISRKFMFSLIVTMIISYVILSLLYNILSAYEARQVAFILSVIGINAMVSGNNVIIWNSHPLTLLITSECSGIFTLMVFLSLVLATPKLGLRKKVSVLSYGIPIIYLANIVRISLAAVFGLNFGEEALFVIHTIIGTLLLLAIVALLWLDWMYFSIHRRISKH